MPGEYDPDKTDVHQAYDIRGEKKVPEEKDCFDHVRAKIHSKEDMDALVKTFRRLGFSIQVDRLTTAEMVSEKFPSEEEEEDGGGRP